VFDFIPAAQHAAILGRTSTYDCLADIQEAIDAIDVSSIGGVLSFPYGTFQISARIAQKNRVALRGANGRATIIVPHSTFSDTCMLHSVNGTSAMFGTWVEDFQFDGRGKNMTSVIYTQAAQETCNIKRTAIIFDGTTVSGILYENGYGGAAMFVVEDLEIFGNSIVSVNNGILVNQVSLVGGFVLKASNITIAGDATNRITRGISLANDAFVGNMLHYEYVVDGVYHAGVGSISLDTVTGSGNPAAWLASLATTSSRPSPPRKMIPNRDTRILDDDATSRDIVSTHTGMLPWYENKTPAFLAQVTSQIANVTGNGEEYVIVFGTEDFDHTSEYSTSTGIFTASKPGKYAFAAGVRATISAGVTYCNFKILAGSVEYFMHRGKTDSLRDNGGQVGMSGSIIVNLENGQTARVVLQVLGLGSATVDIEADTTFFSGHYLGR